MNPKDGSVHSLSSVYLATNQSSFSMIQPVAAVHNLSQVISTATNTLLEKSQHTDNILNRKSIYVCTFCQVFSPSESSIAEHISSVHSESLPAGTVAENFVSKLQALQDINRTDYPKKAGRPKKIQIQRSNATEKAVPNSEPEPAADGFFWCKKCHRYFKKPRQLTRHVCWEENELDNYSEEESVNSDEGTEFRTYMVIDPVPWSHRSKSQNKKAQKMDQISNFQNENTTSICKTDNIRLADKVSNWRNDPNYLPLFQNEEDRLAFEDHLKSIDFSCVDNLFEKDEIGCKRKKNCGKIRCVTYQCIICKKEQKSLSHIRMHCLSHTELKPFTCPKCSYCTNAKGSLYIHMRKHTGNVFKCSSCDFKSARRSHVIEHEATHSIVPQLCKLCKNSYKTVKSLIAHIRRYHDNAGGKKYIKTLTSKNVKETIILCNICNKKFKSTSSFENHNKDFHQPCLYSSISETESNRIIHSESSDKISDLEKDLQLKESSVMSLPDSSILCQSSNAANKDPLAEIVLNNFLQQQHSESIIYPNVFPDSSHPKLLTSTDTLLNNFQPESISEQLSSLSNPTNFPSSDNSVLEECQKTLNLDILDECLQTTNFTDKCIPVTCQQSSGVINNASDCLQSFELPEMDQNLVDETVLQRESVEHIESIPDSIPDMQLADKKCLEETKSAETKLFEKCRRAPAYVCCVCSAIYICSSTLKAHLKGHVNSTNCVLIEPTEENFNHAKISEAENELENVCGILQDPEDTCSYYEKELEKLYTSSLDMIWYLPEVSVVLENDPALFDSVLDDISNFPISDKYDEPEDLNVRASDDNVLECLKELCNPCSLEDMKCKDKID